MSNSDVANLNDLEDPGEAAAAAESAAELAAAAAVIDAAQHRVITQRLRVLAVCAALAWRAGPGALSIPADLRISSYGHEAETRLAALMARRAAFVDTLGANSGAAAVAADRRPLHVMLALLPPAAWAKLDVSSTRSQRDVAARRQDVLASSLHVAPQARVTSGGFGPDIRRAHYPSLLCGGYFIRHRVGTPTRLVSETYGELSKAAAEDPAWFSDVANVKFASVASRKVMGLWGHESGATVCGDWDGTGASRKADMGFVGLFASPSAAVEALDEAFLKPSLAPGDVVLFVQFVPKRWKNAGRGGAAIRKHPAYR